MTYETILVERDGAVATVTLNRPKVLNALNIAMVRELGSAFAALEADAAVRAVIVTGSGDKAFGAGADIGELGALPNSIDAIALVHNGQGLTLQLERMRTPVIAAVNGFALGGGCELAMGCDIRIASAKARFGQPEETLGLLPGYGGTQRTARLLGRGMAMYLCLSGELIDANEALRVGLVERVVPHDDLMTEVKKLAATIASRAPLAVAATKRAIDDGAELSVAAALELEALHFGSLVGTNDFREGTKAFLEKRPAAFTAT
ncbi:MAG: enoyl-CoA hydratase/isomerase family protein [Candidatus Eremiobacteraeota bacterium]|nr:enoyl-CoA hydratase/isomerase family protein [Candidatus Eremiobacteraeota bacterium]